MGQKYNFISNLVYLTLIHYVENACKTTANIIATHLVWTT